MDCAETSANRGGNAPADDFTSGSHAFVHAIPHPRSAFERLDEELATGLGALGLIACRL